MKKIKFLALSMSALLSANFAWGADIVAYTLTPATGSNNSYAENCDVEINGITWNLTGNSTMLPWRLGGKSITDTYRDIYSKTAISDKITKIEVTNGTNSGSISVGEIRLIVSTAQNGGGTVKSTLTTSYSASSTATFACPTGVDWSNCYYKISYKITVSGGSNKYVEFSNAKFYKADEPTYTITAVSNDENLGTVSGTTTITASPTECVGYDDPAYTVAPEGKATVNQSDNTFTVSNVTDNVTVTINFVALTPDTYEDHLHNNTTIEICGSYSAPSLDDATKAITGDCDVDHYHFAGWVTSPISTGTPGAPDGMVTAGTAMKSNGAKYIAVWAKEGN